MRRCRSFIAPAIFAFSATLFALLRTHQYLAVDGATRCLLIYWRGNPILGGSNHLLYFVNVYVWSKALALAGIKPKSALDFIRSVQWMNALAAAGSVSLLFVFCHRASKSMSAGLAAVFAYALSHAFLLHATSTAEPMVGLFWSFLSVWAVFSGLTTSSPLRLLAGGALLALAMATYESMVLIGPAEVVLILYWDERGIAHNRTFLLRFLTGCTLGWIAVYVPAYAISGTTNPVAMLQRFLSMGGGEQTYGGFHLSKLVNLPIGFSNSIVPTVPADYQGIRGLLRTHHFDRTTFSILAILVAAGGWTAWTLRRLALVWDGLQRRQRLILGCCALALVFDLFALLFWDPLYEKLWLQPLAVVFLAWSIIFAASRRLFGARLMLVPEGLLLIVILVTGFTGAVRAHRTPTPCLNAAHDLATIVRPADLLVTGWDPITLLYDAFWETGAARFGVTWTAVQHGPNTLRLLNNAIAGTRARHRQVYFLGVLDMSKTVWHPFLGERAHLPYSSLNQFRRCANPVAKLECADGHKETLWRLPQDCGKP